jgi:hypothetical protein
MKYFIFEDGDHSSVNVKKEEAANVVAFQGGYDSRVTNFVFDNGTESHIRFRQKATELIDMAISSISVEDDPEKAVWMNEYYADDLDAVSIAFCKVRILFGCCNIGIGDPYGGFSNIYINLEDTEREEVLRSLDKVKFAFDDRKELRND